MNSQKVLISSNYSAFYKKWLWLVILVLLLVFVAPLDIRNIPDFLQLPAAILLVFGAELMCIRAFYNISIVYLDDNFLYADAVKIDLRNIVGISQKEVFYSRKITVSYLDADKSEKQIKFIGHFETNLRGNHHPVIDQINDRIGKLGGGTPPIKVKLDY